MTTDELRRLPDHDIMILLYERFDSHIEDHHAAEKRRASREGWWRWALTTLVAVLTIIVTLHIGIKFGP
ncbi:MAG: hypothetical protein ACHQC8_02555 [Solirubrobacterales bacterium]